MAKTKSDIVALALRETGRLALGQTPTGEMNSEAEDAYDQVYDSLKEQGLVTWLSSSVPNEFVPHIKMLVAFILSTGIPAERYNRIAQMAAVAPVRISNLIAGF